MVISVALSQCRASKANWVEQICLIQAVYCVSDR